MAGRGSHFVKPAWLNDSKVTTNKQTSLSGNSFNKNIGNDSSHLVNNNKMSNPYFNSVAANGLSIDREQNSSIPSTVGFFLFALYMYLFY